MRSVQVGTAAVAIGVLGVLATPSGHEPQADTPHAAVHQAAESAPLSAPEHDASSTARGADSSADVRAATEDTGQRGAQSRERIQDPWAQRDISRPGASRQPDTPQPGAERKQPAAEQAGEGGERVDHPQPPAGPPKDQIDRWIDQAMVVLERNGVPREQLDHDAIRTIIEHESGGDPDAVNNWDSNAAAGTPSMGLMQTIDPTFRQYAVPGHGNILHPVDNIVAATRYAIDRYGSVSEVPGVDGVRSGGSYQGY